MSVVHRCVGALLTAWGLTQLALPGWIAWMRTIQFQQVVRDDGPQHHRVKTGTPTMGGVPVVLALMVAVAIWARWTPHVGWLMGVLLLGSSVGWLDDYLKAVRRQPHGLRAWQKYGLQTLCTVGAAVGLHSLAASPVDTWLWAPWGAAWSLGGWHILWSYAVMISCSNAVNLTDGLDGLAIVPVMTVGGALGVLAYGSGLAWDGLPHVTDAQEIAVVCSALIGVGLGFLWFNAHPAKVFMGDVGALGLGALLGAIAVVVHQALLLAWMGGVFVLEAVSVMLQVGSYRLRGRKRIFRMAPIHHHLELGGWSENQVVIRLWLITWGLVCTGLGFVLMS